MACVIVVASACNKDGVTPNCPALPLYSTESDAAAGARAAAAEAGCITLPGQGGGTASGGSSGHGGSGGGTSSGGTNSGGHGGTGQAGNGTSGATGPGGSAGAAGAG